MLVKRGEAEEELSFIVCHLMAFLSIIPSLSFPLLVSLSLSPTTALSPSLTTIPPSLLPLPFPYLLSHPSPLLTHITTVLYAYEQCLLCFGHCADIWYEAALYLQRASEAAVSLSLSLSLSLSPPLPSLSLLNLNLKIFYD